MTHRLRKATAISLCTVLTLSLVLKVSAIVWYEVNQSYIASELCEQKEVMDNNCEGHCQLSKKLQLTENTSEDNGKPLISQQFELITFVLPLDASVDETLVATSSEFTEMWTLGMERDYIGVIDHPPAG